MAADRTRSINALTALLRSFDLGMYARKPLTSTQIDEISRWGSRQEPLALSTARSESAVKRGPSQASPHGRLNADNGPYVKLRLRGAPQKPGLALIAAAVVVWTKLFFGLITALWASDWIGRLLAIFLLLPLAGIVIQPIGHLINKRRGRALATAAMHS